MKLNNRKAVLQGDFYAYRGLPAGDVVTDNIWQPCFTQVSMSVRTPIWRQIFDISRGEDW